MLMGDIPFFDAISEGVTSFPAGKATIEPVFEDVVSESLDGEVPVLGRATKAFPGF